MPRGALEDPSHTLYTIPADITHPQGPVSWFHEHRTGQVRKRGLRTRAGDMQRVSAPVSEPVWRPH